MLKTDYKDDILNTEVNVNRKFNIVRSNGTLVEQNVELRETTVFEQEGDSFGAKDINETNEAIVDVRGQIHTNLLNPTAQTQTMNGVTFTNNGDGTYTVNGTATDRIYFTFYSDNANFLKVGETYKYIVKAPNQSGISDQIYYWDNGSYSANFVNGVFEYNNSHQKVLIRIQVAGNATFNNVIIKPMLTTDLSATYDDFVPYTGDSGRLNEDVANLVKGKEISPIPNSDIDTILNS